MCRDPYEAQLARRPPAPPTPDTEPLTSALALVLVALAGASLLVTAIVAWLHP